jgi:CheY-like chemotaxis protein
LTQISAERPLRLSLDDKHALIVDDSRAQRLLFARHLQGWGYQTTEAGSGADALALCETTHFDLILSDWMMPGMTGLELLDKVKAEFPQIQVSMISAYGDSENYNRAINSGAKGFFVKPIDFDSLKGELKEIIGNA